MSETTTATPKEGEGRTELRRVMGPKLLLLFIVGDILGTGVYALTGDVAAEVGGAAWAPFIVAFVVAMITAFSYLELVTKYPQAAGAALYAHKAFGIHFLTFIIAFTVMCSGITSASTASRAFASNLAKGFKLDDKNTVLIVCIALAFMLLIALVNFRGVGESVKANIVLTMVELSGLLLVILVGFWAIFGGQGDFSRTVVFDSPSDKSAFFAVTAATSLAFFAMVGFEDSVNMAEETKDPVRIFPKMMITGISVTGLIYVLIALCSVALVPVGVLADSDTPLVTVVETAAPGIPVEQILPFISLFAVANSALINMLMASRLLYGPAGRASAVPRQGPPHPPHAVRGDHLHHGALPRSDRLRQPGQQRLGGRARRDDRAAAPRRLHDRQHLRTGPPAARCRPGPHPDGPRRQPAQRRGTRDQLAPLPHPDRASRDRGAGLRVPRDAVLRARRVAVRSGRLPAGAGGRPLGGHLVREPCAPGAEDVRARPRRPWRWRAVVTREEVMRWVRAYEDGWRAEDRSAVGRLFTGEAKYLRSPYASPLVGHAAIESFWVDDAEDGSAFTMSAEPVAVEGTDAVVRVVVRYGGPVTQEYRDLWVLRFADDGRVEHFEEWAYWPEKPFTT